jgi:hypothetical protein
MKGTVEGKGRSQRAKNRRANLLLERRWLKKIEDMDKKKRIRWTIKQKQKVSQSPSRVTRNQTRLMMSLFRS